MRTLRGLSVCTFDWLVVTRTPPLHSPTDGQMVGQAGADGRPTLLGQKLTKGETEQLEEGRSTDFHFCVLPSVDPRWCCDARVRALASVLAGTGIYASTCRR